MKYIKLTKGCHAVVDDEDYERLNKWSWHALGGKYAARRKTIGIGKTKIVYMHAEILNTPKGKATDHINGQTFDNRKFNLRICTKSENALGFQRRKKNCSSGFRGVSWNKEKRKWESYITLNGERHKCGYFKNEAAAALARDCAAVDAGIFFTGLNFKSLQEAIDAARKLPGDMTAR